MSRDAIIKHWGIVLFEGILFLFLGLTAIVMPGVFAIGLEIIAGWLILVAGILHAARAFRMMKAPGFSATLLSGVLGIACGCLLLFYPLSGVLTLTVLLGIYFVLSGLTKVALSFQMRPLPNWGFLFVDGLISLLIAGLIWGEWPLSASWFLGTLIGIYLIFFGLSLIAMATAIKKNLAQELSS